MRKSLFIKNSIMKNVFNYTIQIIFLIISMVSCQSKEMKKAKKFYKDGIPDQAIAYLQAEVKNHPDNAEAYYYLGLSNDKIFQIKLEKQSSKIDPLINELINSKGISWNDRIREIENRENSFVEEIKKFIETINENFDHAVKIDSSYRERIGKYYYEKSVDLFINGIRRECLVIWDYYRYYVTYLEAGAYYDPAQADKYEKIIEEYAEKLEKK